MREIKFRVFYQDKMHFQDQVAGSNGFISLADVYLGYGDDWEGAKNAPVMQYTGLKDKNGVEIYEGDIVKHYGRIDTWKISEDGIAEVKITPISTYPFFILDDTSKWEVIGNIYENPELRIEDEIH